MSPYIFDNYCVYCVADFDQFSSFSHRHVAIKELMRKTLVSKASRKGAKLNISEAFRGERTTSYDTYLGLEMGCQKTANAWNPKYASATRAPLP